MHAFIEAHRPEFSVRSMCRMFMGAFQWFLRMAKGTAKLSWA